MRKPTACTQCRRMKLACDGERPCRRCISQNRVALCKSQGSNVVSQGEKDGSVSQYAQLALADSSRLTVSRVKSGTRPASPPFHDELSSSSSHMLNQDDTRIPGSNNNTASIDTATSTKSTTVIDSETGEIIAVGQYASMLHFQSLLSDSQQSSISTNAILSAFLLRNESTIHPFGTLWRPGWNLADIFDALPESRLCLKYFEAYREASKHYLPICIDFVDFEQRMCSILQQRNEIGLVAATDQSVHGGSVAQHAWCGLWFAVLAAGCQWSESLSPSSSERDVTIKVFVACSFECLRRANLYACSSLEILQTLLLLEAVVCNAGNPGLAWNMLGTTWRQAYGIGLSMPESSVGSLANSLWNSILELDAAISYPYNRVPLAALTCRDRIRRSACYDQIARPLTSHEEAGRRLHYLRMEFQNEDWPNLTSDAKTECLNSSLSKVEILISLMMNLPAGTASEIKDVEICKIMTWQFKADLHRLSSVAENTDIVLRMRNREEAKLHYHQVLLSFDRLMRFETPRKLSWSIRQSVTSSALILGALDRADLGSDYKVIVHKTILTLEDVPILTDEIANEFANALRGNESASETSKHASALVWALYEDT